MNGEALIPKKITILVEFDEGKKIEYRMYEIEMDKNPKADIIPTNLVKEDRAQGKTHMLVFTTLIGAVLTFGVLPAWRLYEGGSLSRDKFELSTGELFRLALLKTLDVQQDMIASIHGHKRTPEKAKVEGGMYK